MSRAGQGPDLHRRLRVSSARPGFSAHSAQRISNFEVLIRAAETSRVRQCGPAPRGAVGRGWWSRRGCDARSPHGL